MAAVLFDSAVFDAVVFDNVTSADTFDSAVFDSVVFDAGGVASVDFSSATTNGADIGAAAVAPLIGVSSATTNGADIGAAQVSPVVGLSSATVNGADSLAALVDMGASLVAGGYDDNKPKRKRYVVQVNGQIKVFSSANRALDALNADKPELLDSVTPELLDVVAIDAVKLVVGKAKTESLLTQKHLDALYAEYEARREEQDIEDLLTLL